MENILVQGLTKKMQVQALVKECGSGGSPWSFSPYGDQEIVQKQSFPCLHCGPQHTAVAMSRYQPNFACLRSLWLSTMDLVLEAGGFSTPRACLRCHVGLSYRHTYFSIGFQSRNSLLYLAVLVEELPC